MLYKDRVRDIFRIIGQVAAMIIINIIVVATVTSSYYYCQTGMIQPPTGFDIFNSIPFSLLTLFVLYYLR